MLIAVVAGAATALALVWRVPAPLVLPAICLLALSAAIAVSAVAWLLARHNGAASINCWDIAGALTFVSVFAALLSEPELVLALLDTQRTE